MAVNETTIPTKVGDTVFYINDIDPFRVQGICNQVSKLLDLQVIAGLFHIVKTKQGVEIAKVIPAVLKVMQGADEEVLQKLVGYLLCHKACKYRTKGIEGYRDFEMEDVAKLFTGKFTSLYKLLGFAFEVNFRPLVEELLELIPRDDEAPAKETPSL